MRRAGTLAAVWLVAALVGPPAAARLVDAILADVAGTPVAASDIALARALGRFGLAPAATPIDADEVRRYVDARLVVRAATELTIEGTPEEREAAWQAAADRLGGGRRARRVARSGRDRRGLGPPAGRGRPPLAPVRRAPVPGPDLRLRDRGRGGARARGPRGRRARASAGGAARGRAPPPARRVARRRPAPDGHPVAPRRRRHRPRAVPDARRRDRGLNRPRAGQGLQPERAVRGRGTVNAWQACCCRWSATFTQPQTILEIVDLAPARYPARG